MNCVIRFFNHTRGGQTSPGGTDLRFSKVSSKTRLKFSNNFPEVSIKKVELTGGKWILF